MHTVLIPSIFRYKMVALNAGDELPDIADEIDYAVNRVFAQGIMALDIGETTAK